MSVELAKEMALLDHVSRKNRINELMERMEFWGVHSLVAAIDFYEGGVLTREEALEVSGVGERAFADELAARKSERRRLMQKRPR